MTGKQDKPGSSRFCFCTLRVLVLQPLIPLFARRVKRIPVVLGKVQCDVWLQKFAMGRGKLHPAREDLRMPLRALGQYVLFDKKV